jgi:hypothetical protein
MSTKRLRLFLLLAPSSIGFTIWALTLTNALHPTLRSWALASNLLAWLPVPGTVGDILTLDYPGGSNVRRCSYWGAAGGALILGYHFLT